ncbi:MAG: ISL3 family transposase [Halochromatium sp.]|nr:ISL3 family transposase [Halochromatium sp.]
MARRFPIESHNALLKQALQSLIDLPNIQIQEAFEDRNGNYILTIISTEKGAHCHKCNKRVVTPNGYSEWIVVRHLDILGKQVYLRFRLPRYQCEDCTGRPTTTQQLSWLTRRSRFTKAFEAQLLLACVNSTVADVSIKHDVPYEAVNGVIDRNIQRSVAWDNFLHLDGIGIDEISLKKGHQDYVVIVTGRCDEKTHILAVLKDRTKQTVKQFFLSIPKRLRKTIGYVCSDMYDGFINAAKEVFGKRVRLVADRFHVAKLYRDGVETLRKKELKRLKKSLSKTEYDKLKGAMWALRKKEADLTDEDRAVLNALFLYSPKLKAAYQFRDQLTAIFDQNISRTKAKRLLNGWIARVQRSDVRCFDAFIKTLESRQEEIANYFVGRRNSGFVEGLNNKIKVIKRRCYGILNAEHLFQRIHLDLFGYKMYAKKNSGLYA